MTFNVRILYYLAIRHPIPLTPKMYPLVGAGRNGGALTSDPPETNYLAELCRATKINFAKISAKFRRNEMAKVYFPGITPR